MQLPGNAIYDVNRLKFYSCIVEKCRERTTPVLWVQDKLASTEMQYREDQSKSNYILI